MSDIILEAKDVQRTFMVPSGFMQPKRPLHAVNGVNLSVARGEVLALVGESGCGKTTLAKMLLGLLRPTSGTLNLDGQPVQTMDRMTVAKTVQPIFQDPYSSLNPRKLIGSIITLPLKVQGDPEPETWKKRAEEMMELVGLPRRVFNNYPNQLSGGQRQRVAIARALINKPRVVICDEPTSALDVSVQSQILNLLQDLRSELGLTYLIISHNLAVVEHMATKLAVMYLGRIVEQGDAASVFSKPKHPLHQGFARLSADTGPQSWRTGHTFGSGLSQSAENAERLHLPPPVRTRHAAMLGLRAVAPDATGRSCGMPPLR